MTSIDKSSSDNVLAPKDICEVIVVEDDADFRFFQKNNPSGLAMIPEKYGELDQPVLSADAGDFAKWLKEHAPKMTVQTRKADRLTLRSNDYWLPLVFLAKDIALPAYLNLVSNYIYDKMKGALRGESARVHLSAVYEDKTAGVTRRFNFEGDAETLQKVIEKGDFKQFFNE